MLSRLAVAGLLIEYTDDTVRAVAQLFRRSLTEERPADHLRRHAAEIVQVAIRKREVLDQLRSELAVADNNQLGGAGRFMAVLR